jgi:hypothetical protein
MVGWLVNSDAWLYQLVSKWSSATLKVAAIVSVKGAETWRLNQKRQSCSSTLQKEPTFDYDS